MMAPTRITRLFASLKDQKKKDMIAYITAGRSVSGADTRADRGTRKGGADLIELGVPFSDPIVDGPVIQRGGERALRAGTSMRTVLEIARKIRTRSEIPLLLFTYLNPVVRYGSEALAADAAANGIDGCLLTDASVEEAGDYVKAMQRCGLDTVFLAAPTSTKRRLRLAAKYSTGFVYLVSRTGVTGERDSLPVAAKPLVQAIRAITDLPLAVGFGISKPGHVADLGRPGGGSGSGKFVRESDRAQ